MADIEEEKIEQPDSINDGTVEYSEPTETETEEAAELTFDEYVQEVMKILPEQNVCEHTKGIDTTDVANFMERLNSENAVEDSSCIHGAYMKGISSDEDLTHMFEVIKTPIKLRRELMAHFRPEITDEDLLSEMRSLFHNREKLKKFFTDDDYTELDSQTDLYELMLKAFQALVKNSERFFIALFTVNLSDVCYYIVAEDNDGEMFVAYNSFEAKIEE